MLVGRHDVEFLLERPNAGDVDCSWHSIVVEHVNVGGFETSVVVLEQVFQNTNTIFFLSRSYIAFLLTLTFSCTAWLQSLPLVSEMLTLM